MGKPSPVPPLSRLLVKNGSNTRATWPSGSPSLLSSQRRFQHLPDRPLIRHPLRRRAGLHRVEQRCGEAHVDLFRFGGEFEAVGLERGQVELRQIGLADKPFGGGVAGQLGQWFCLRLRSACGNRAPAIGRAGPIHFAEPNGEVAVAPATDGGVSGPAKQPLRLACGDPPPHLRHSPKMERIQASPSPPAFGPDGCRSNRAPAIGRAGPCFCRAGR